MKIVKYSLYAGCLFILILFNVQSASAAEKSTSGIAILHDGNRLETFEDQGQVIYPFEQERCDRALSCSHPDELYRGGGFVALTAAQHWIEISCPASTSMGIQLRGDDNDGWARVTVDGDMAWEGNTYGHGNGGVLFIKFLEISGLTESSHALRIEAMGISGKDGGDVHVAIVGFACNAMETKHDFMNYLPIVQG